MAIINSTNFGSYPLFGSYGKFNVSYGIGRASKEYGKSKAAYEFLRSSYENNAVPSYNFLPDLKQKASALSASIKSLSGRSKDSAFKLKSAISSNTEALTAKYDNNSKRGLSALLKPIEVKVDRVAVAQQNESKSFISSGKSIKAGSYGFAIDAGNKSHSFSVKINDWENDRSSLQKIADAVNERNIGVKASVGKGDDKNSVKLVFEAASTGKKDDEGAVFTLRDLYAPDGDEGLISATRTDKTTREAQNAQYSVNGAKKSSQSNDVDLGGGVTATLKKESPDTVKVSLGKNAEAIKTEVNSFVESYNSLMSGSDSRSKVAVVLSGVTNSYQRSLSNVGIEASSAGRLFIDSQKLDSVISSGRLEELFTSGGSYGLGERLRSAADEIERNPMGLMGTASLLTTYNASSAFNSYYPSMFSGMLFNYML